MFFEFSGKLVKKKILCPIRNKKILKNCEFF